MIVWKVTSVLTAIAAVVLGVWAVNDAQSQVYSDGKDCVLTSNPPIAGRIVDGIIGCVPLSKYGTSTILEGGYPIRSGDGHIAIFPRTLTCPADTEKVLVPGGVKCARGLVDPE